MGTYPAFSGSLQLPEQRLHGTSNLHPAGGYRIELQVQDATFDKYPAKQHAQRVAAKLKKEKGLIFLMGQKAALLEDSDQETRFRQRRYFFYMSGVNEADCDLTYDIQSDKLTLYVPNFDLRREIWMGPTLGPEEALKRFDIDEAKYQSFLEGDIKQWASCSGHGSTIYILHGSQKPTGDFPNVLMDSETLKPAMNACRVVKDEHEIELMRHANRVSSAAHIAVLQGIRKMTNEAQIEGSFLNTCVSLGAHNQAYGIIAASGANAATLHYSKNNEPLKGRQFVCLDAGAEWDCYASDVTRTFPTAARWPGTEAEQIYALVQNMQESCILRIKEGVRYLDLHYLAHDILIHGFLAIGIFKAGRAEEIKKSGASSLFFPHGLGHHIGLEVHDVSPDSLFAQDNDRTTDSWLFSSTYLSPCTASSPTLKSGMVVTVEPGIYFSQIALDNAKSEQLKHIDMDVVKRYMAVGGVRIEDDILVTKDGFENLTLAPKGQAMLDYIQQGNGSCNI
ncbi:xaa-Pro dipeptidase [Paracoccidioides lutzii Pb01]|uniref:Probable Xaa-Pro aminopeptidase PAAG_05466 n=1 Tax=Paracoccidioides lutzii (strain ATCC MYA-826 / Pb01) TaxID=502779 RepID=AMPP2_PARBA|nr:xaa-Pro dipeptidase [Paracoccidioides lutzii Pb01]C1H3X3.2 RecName: Full=Probable Xaa-Pro aminopeptidase PAAG_05466; AltName: Full=Aminoacylproline aminopeptidase; AltName: Full=Prolidase [Paracoccidioides lutzii Pb01]EEH34417.2 xaa-Pro dipeptidase [Paracoccidioides lutzii Pb01]